MNEIKINQMNETILSLVEKYSDNEYMQEKLAHYVINQLPTVMDNIWKSHENRKTRINDLTHEQEQFMKSFLQTNQYFYVSTTDKFFYYDGLHYMMMNEDEVLHHILSSISTHSHRQLLVWKQRTKMYLMKRIKDNNLMVKSLPESDTIQGVLGLFYPSIFSTKHQAKYFLTVLGDNMFKKTDNIVHLISPKSKRLLQELTSVSQMCFGVNVANSFIYKYYDHEYENCRIINAGAGVESSLAIENIIRNSIDVLCVACHYSMRYQSSDQYITEYCNDESISDSIMFLRTHTREWFVSTFIAEYLQKRRSNSIPSSEAVESSVECEITWKNMIFLWKHFLHSRGLSSSIMFQSKLKPLLVGQLEKYYSEEGDSFVNISSKFMPSIGKFLQFWEKNIRYDKSSLNMEYEVEELCILYKRWCQSEFDSHINISEKQMIDLILHYYPDTQVENDKYVYGIICVLWDKADEIEKSLNKVKEHLKNMSEYDPSFMEDDINQIISLNDLYSWYTEDNTSPTNKQKKLLVSKIYFEKYMYFYYDQYIADNCVNFGML